MRDSRIINTTLIRDAIVQLIHGASFQLHPETRKTFIQMRDTEDSEIARQTLDTLILNDDIAAATQLPLCQDCGSVVVFLEIGQQVIIEGEPLNDAIHGAVALAYEKYYLRKSIVADPLQRVNTNTNTPSFIHVDMVPGDRLGITVYLKGGGSENMSALNMFRPTASEDEIIEYIVQTVQDAGPNPCPPLFLGVGIGGTADAAMVNAKKAVLREPGTSHPVDYYRKLEEKILRGINDTGVGPLGFGGRNTAAAVFIKEAPTHIATLPVALNLNCHSLRYRGTIL
ncbi:MAG: fumarate hydratase [Spirochaetota bacterium]